MDSPFSIHHLAILLFLFADNGAADFRTGVLFVCVVCSHTITFCAGYGSYFPKCLYTKVHIVEVHGSDRDHDCNTHHPDTRFHCPISEAYRYGVCWAD